ncbi:g2898 [Coccomyxa viridis]|uniref:G2898 protein n=1 Tax=Coccomyxa viridis TaxID=1274662 RepID=A0ABP1FPH6_9CHLO
MSASAEDPPMMGEDQSEGSGGSGAGQDGLTDDPVAVAKAMRRHELLKLKNRRAQARYRERTKAKALVWQEQVEVLTQALQQANAEKAVLAADKGRLEQEVANLRLQMSVFHKAMEGGQLMPSSAPLAMSAPSGLPQPVSPVHPMVQQGMQELNRAAPQAAGGETDPETQQAVQRVLTVVRGTSNGATPELTLDDVVRFYNVWVRELAAALLVAGDKASSKGQRGVEELVLAGREVSRKLYAQLPELSQLLDRTLARAPKEEYGPPPSSLWHRLVDKAHLSLEQQLKVIALRHNLLAQMDDILQDRKRMIATLQADAAAADKGSARVEALLAAGQVTAQLKASQAQEQQLVSAFLHHLCEQVLDPIQEAIMVVDAHPYVVNALAVCTATAEASAKVSAPMSDLMKRCLEEELPPACSPLPADSTFRALFNGEIRIHQGAAMLVTSKMGEAQA